MKYIDYEWEIHPDKIMLDQELNIDKLGWKNGDHFELININGRAQLVKVDPLVKFLKGYK
jgi:hypothetical protein